MNFSDISCFLNKLKMKQKVLEKNGRDFIRNINDNYGIDLDDENIVIQLQDEQQLFSLEKSVQQNNKLLQELKSIVSPDNIPKIDLLALKHKMLSLENSIQSIKCRISNDMENLQTEESNLFIEVMNLEIKYSETNRAKFETNKIFPTPLNRKSENPSLYQEVEDFANFVNNNGGHEGGWSQSDHLIFLKYYYKNKPRKILCKILQNFLPDFTEEKISNHIDWYTEYVSLREKQKSALEEWRQNKKKTNKNTEIEKKSSPVEKKKEHNDLERQNIKEKINKWKLEKQQITESKLKSQGDFEKKIENENKLKQKMKIEMKNDVNKWRASKKAQEKAEKLKKEVISLKEKEHKIMIANALIREFQKQDSLFIMRRINKHHIKTDNFYTPITIRKGQTNKYRDPERIFRATRQWLSRISCGDNDLNMDNNPTKLFSKGPLNVQQIPKLRIPTWRLAAN